MKCKMNVLVFLILFLSLFSWMFPNSPAPRTPLLKTVLENCANYCAVLEKAVFHFICLEQIKQKITSRSRQQFTYDYQVIKDKNKVRERRILISRNKTEISRKKGKDRFSADIFSFRAALAPVFFLSQKNQPKFLFQIAGYKKVMGRKTLVIRVSRKPDIPHEGILKIVRKNREAVLEYDKSNRLTADIWVDPAGYSVAGFRVYPAGIAGYNKLVETAFRRHQEISISDIHLFGLLKDGIRYPTETRIRLKYKNIELGSSPTLGLGHVPGLGMLAGITGKQGPKQVFRVTTVFRYFRHRFFKVKTGKPEFAD